MYTPESLTYCSNVHPGETLDAVLNNITHYFSPVRQARQLKVMASGLWLSAKSAQVLINDSNQLQHFKHHLAQNGVLLTSLNGFPYGDFHQAVVKTKVYLPDWADKNRLIYSQNCAQILSSCLPDSIQHGAISTLPFGYAKNWSDQKQALATQQLIKLTHFLIELEKTTGKTIQFGIEMEPDCVFETTPQLVEYFTQTLLPTALQQGLTQAQVLKYIGCCYDTCHQAVLSESISESLTQITQAGIQIFKIQISNAVVAQLNQAEDIKKLTQLFNDAKFLHQTKVQTDTQPNAQLKTQFNAQTKTQTKTQKQVALDDLSSVTLQPLLLQHQAHLQTQQSQAKTKAKSEVQRKSENTSGITAKIHYHIPINQTHFPFEFISSTQSSIQACLDFLANTPTCRPYLEVETYTWLNFLQSEVDQNKVLIQGLTKELDWLTTQLSQRNLLNVSS